MKKKSILIVSAIVLILCAAVIALTACHAEKKGTETATSQAAEQTVLPSDSANDGGQGSGAERVSIEVGTAHTGDGTANGTAAPSRSAAAQSSSGSGENTTKGKTKITETTVRTTAGTRKNESRSVTSSAGKTTRNPEEPIVLPPDFD